VRRNTWAPTRWRPGSPTLDDAGGARNLIERFFNKIKHCRRVATRYDKLAANYLAFVQLASIRLWLRVNESTTSRASPASCLPEPHTAPE